MTTLFYLITVLLLSSIDAQNTKSVVILDDGQKPKMARWSTDGPITDTTGVDYISGEKGRGYVIKLNGLGLHNSFVFSGNKGVPLAPPGKNVLQWKMKYKEPFIVDVEVSTNEGKKHLLYSDLSEKVNNKDKYIHFGLGTRFNDGNWHTVTRDLQDDLGSMVPNVKIQSINSVSFKGAGYIDDIKVMDKKPVDVLVVSGSSGTKSWKRLGKGGSINVDYDKVLGDVVTIDSGINNTTFQLQRSSGVWDLTLTPILQWKMKMQDDYKFYVIVESTKGRYILVYDDENKSKLYDPKTKMVHYGLGYYSVDNQWHAFTRDINEDLKRVFPNADPIKIGAILLKGKGALSDIRLLMEMPFEHDSIKGWEVYDDDPSGAKITPLNDLEKGEVAEFYGESLKNGYRYSGKNGAFSESSGKPIIRWDMRFSEIFDIMLAIESDGVARYVHYVSMPTDYVRIKDNELYIGLGETKTDRRWHTIIRDLSSDVKLLLKSAGYSSCKYFLVRGSGRVGNIEFFEMVPVEKRKNVPSMSASVVVGQYSFGHDLRNLWGDDSLKVNGFDSPYSVAVDEGGGIYVSDSVNNRIMYWDRVPDNYGANPEFIVNNGLKMPTALFIADKKLFVTDTGNNRVLVYNLPMNEDSSPNMVIEGYFKEPRAVFFDGLKLFIADTGNNRLLIWNTFPKTQKQMFDVVLGQSNLTDVSPNRGQEDPNYNTMNLPSGIYSDGNSLYVSDTGNNRVLLFKQIPTMNGWHADEVLGQEKFKDAKPNRGGRVSAMSFKEPRTILVSDGKLYVCDTGNNRILFFNINKGLSSAEGVLGQATFSSSGRNYPTGIPNSYTLAAPSSISIKDGVIYVVDKGNNRVLIY